jgi:hypothetical protein
MIVARSLAIVLGCVVLACSTPNATPTRLENIIMAPDSLESLAANTRAAGGIIVVGHADGTRTAHGSRMGPAPNLPGLFVSVSLDSVGVSVTDGMGDTNQGHLDLVTPNGPTVVVDEHGVPDHDYIVEDSEEIWERSTMPATGDWVLFTAIDDTGTRWLSWRAALLSDGTVDASGTRSGHDVTLSSLRSGV